jgi:hypothetical protein
MFRYHRKKDIESFKVKIEKWSIKQFEFIWSYGWKNTFSSTTNLHNNAVIPYNWWPLYICTRNKMFSLQNNNINLSHFQIRMNDLASFQLRREELDNYFSK